jgi:hypothetical protein
MATLRVTNLRGRSANIAPDLPDGANITGVCTATSFVGALTGTATGLAGSPQVTVGVSTFSADVTFDNGTNDGKDITWDESLDHLVFADDVYAKFGSGGDLAIYHNGTTSYVSGSNGDLYVQTTGSGDDLILQSVDDISLKPQGGESGIEIIGDGAVEAYYDNSKKLETTSSGITVTGTVSDSDGELRSLPVNSQGSAYSLVAADAGKMIKITTGGVTCPNGESFAAGDMITILNESGSDQTITQGGGATLYNTADGSTGNRTLGARGVATIVMTGTAAFYISGSGLS